MGLERRSLEVEGGEEKHIVLLGTVWLGWMMIHTWGLQV